MLHVKSKVHITKHLSNLPLQKKIHRLQHRREPDLAYGHIHTEHTLFDVHAYGLHSVEPVSFKHLREQILSKAFLMNDRSSILQNVTDDQGQFNTA